MINFIKRLFNRKQQQPSVSDYCKTIVERRLTDPKSLPPIYFLFWHKDSPDRKFRTIEEVKADIRQRQA